MEPGDSGESIEPDATIGNLGVKKSINVSDAASDSERSACPAHQTFLMPLQFKSGLLVFALVALACVPPCLGQTPERSPAPGSEQLGATSAGERPPDQQLSGNVNGTVVDASGAVVSGAQVKLTHDDRSKGRANELSKDDPSVKDQSSNAQSPQNQSASQEVISGADGQFSFANISPGPFQLTVAAAGFAKQTFSGVLHSGEIRTVPQIALAVATTVTDVEVELTRTEVATQEIKIEEKQRVLGIVPNFYVSYIPDAVPLSSKQKFQIAWKTVIDPITFLMVGGAAGVEQAQNHFSGYGQGAQGYAKRFGANYADTFAGTFIGSAILPSILKQDPRYFYKGTGSIGSRFLYAIANSVICKGDNGHWQTNYSNILGNMAAGGISNIYYPAQDRDGAALTFENAAIGIGASAVGNVLQEFLIKKITPKVPNRDPSKP